MKKLEFAPESTAHRGWTVPAAVALRPIIAVIAVMLAISGAVTVLAAQESVSLEQQLIEKYSPIVALKDQTSVCDTEGEPYFPVAVDAVLNDPTVVLKQATTDSSRTDPVIVTGPSSRDLYAKGADYYLDLPGNPRKPGCSYATRFAERKDALTPTTYAHIIANGTDKLAIQYWFFYVYNDFNNKHESDWEMMQIIFDVGTVEEALSAEPSQVAFAQHGGGETADWTSSKLQRDGSHPIVYPAAGSHASQYGSATWLGWGENGTGFGCDITTGPSTLVSLTPVLLPDKAPGPESEFAWLTYTGRWGEKQFSEYSGPTGPNTKSQWRSPFLWQSDLRDSSIEVPGSRAFGPAPTSVFCSLSAEGSAIFTRLGDQHALLAATAALLIGIIAGLIAYSRRLVGLATGLYRVRLRSFAFIGLMLIPIGILFNGFQYLVAHVPPGNLIIAVMGKSPGSYFAMALLVGIVQQFASLIVVGPAVIQVFGDLEAQRSHSPVEAYRSSLKHLPVLAPPVLRSTAIIVLLALTIVGIPFAIRNLVRWMFIPQAVMLDGRRGADARAESERSVDGHWLQTAVKAALLTFIGATPGVVIGLILLVFGSASVQMTNIVSSLVYAVVLPFSILGMTILYRQHQGRSIPTVRRQDLPGRTDATASPETANGPA
ncbi:MAG TPA: hypothetical protein VNZ58_04860 [Thermomicrobiales bacterium]|nr:hypothetical protein [Thermomicrobiales bacterium]